ncbi:kinase-like domain-containing protein, partial [Russula compacta]
GLACLHEHGVAHLDIKPGNLVHTDDCRLPIIDFGSAVRVGSEDDTAKGIYGTPGWVAPEILERGVFSPLRADRWSCGKVLFSFLEERRTVDGDLRDLQMS